MSGHLSRQWACLFFFTLAIAPASAQDVAKYREFNLGTSVASVVALSGSRAADVKTLHEEPALLQELLWRPRYSAGRALPDVDPVREAIFAFSGDQLYRITVYYDRTRTTGLTHDDLVRALTDIYGAPAPTTRSERRDRFEPSEAATLIAFWERGDTLVSLYWSDARAGYGLRVMSQQGESKARLAMAEAVATDEREAPAREAARQKKDADALKAADERARETNKGAFRP
jgi:hypothetical protein